MSRQPEPRRFGPPRNPELRELVSNKRRFASPQELKDVIRGFRGWHERGYLPHRDEPGLVQFVTFRLADSLPDSLRSELEHLWRLESDRARRCELERCLDRGVGECHLRRPDVAPIVEDALRLFHNDRYHLRAWTVMPNHVHVLFAVKDRPMSDIVGSWKKHTAQKVNRLLKRRGKLWAEDYWDTYMRDADQERRAIHYIESNPVKAKLILDPKSWSWSSARLRDDFRRLPL